MVLCFKLFMLKLFNMRTLVDKCFIQSLILVHGLFSFINVTLVRHIFYLLMSIAQYL